MTMSYLPTSKEAVFARIQETGNLPTLPEILIKLLEVCEDESTPLVDIACLISKDPVLSFRVLQLVNSAYYGFRQTFTGIEQAVVYLGINSIRNIAITTSIHQVFESRSLARIKRFSLSAFWWHSLMCATLAKRIAGRTRFDNHDEAYLSGLLHDIGRLVLVSTFPKEHECILQETKDSRNMIWAETQLIGVTHGEVGAWVIEKWKLNSLMADAIRYHHESMEHIAESFPLVKIVYLSNLLCDVKHGEAEGSEAGELFFNLAESDIREIIQGATDEVTSIAKSLGINARPDDPAQTEANGHERNPDDEGSEPGASKKQESINEDTVIVSSTPVAASAQKKLVSRIKNVTLLSTFLENLIKAGKPETIIEAFEQCLRVLFDIEKVLFFLPDRDGVLLKGMTSSVNILQQMSRGLTLPVQRSSSRIVTSYVEMESSALSADDPANSLIDKQLLSALKSKTVLLIPIVAEKKSIGILLLGLPGDMSDLPGNDRQVMEVIVRQVGLCLYLEGIKEKQAAEVEAQRMAAISMTAKKLAHEINNPLGILGNYLASLKLKLPEEKGFQEEFQIIDEELSRISMMVNQLDLISQPAYTAIEPVDINSTVADIVQLLASSLDAKQETSISFVADPLLPQIRTSKDALKQIVINIAKNALEAVPKGGRVEVRTRMIADQGDDRKREGVEITVKDNGPGLPDEVKENLFKPFTTTKGQGHAGLGLSIVFKTLKDIKGSISYKSLQSKGTSFKVFLPDAKDIKL